MGRQPKVAECHPEREHVANGLCDSCYRKTRRSYHPRAVIVPTCHPERKHKAKGLCAACYTAPLIRRRLELNPGIDHKTRAKYMISKRAQLKQEFLEAYGRKCACCGETTEEFLSLDHVNGGGKAHRDRLKSVGAVYQELKALGWPQDDYRLLCMNCNFATRGGKICPHQRSPH